MVCFRFLHKTDGGSNGPILVLISRQHYLPDPVNQGNLVFLVSVAFFIVFLIFVGFLIHSPLAFALCSTLFLLLFHALAHPPVSAVINNNTRFYLSSSTSPGNGGIVEAECQCVSHFLPGCAGTRTDETPWTVEWNESACCCQSIMNFFPVPPPLGERIPPDSQARHIEARSCQQLGENALVRSELESHTATNGSWKKR